MAISRTHLLAGNPNGDKVNVWVPSKDTGIDLLVTDKTNKNTTSLQVKFSKDFLLTHGRPEYRDKLLSCGWWTLNREKIRKSSADYWVFVLHTHDIAALCRSTYFQQALASHPAITQLQSFTPVLDQRAQPLPICINLEGIAQHYGLPTEYLDITSSFAVASFFATQHWNTATQTFEPMRAVSSPGVIYKLHPASLMSQPVPCAHVLV